MSRSWQSQQIKFTNTHTMLTGIILFFLLYTEIVAQSLQCLTTDWTTGFDPLQMQRISSLASVSGPALTLTQLPIQWVLGALSQG
jgi:hypothetical protein